MKSVHPLHEFMPYGAPDLLVAQRPNLSRALALSSSLALGLWLALCAIVPGLAPPAPIELPIPRIPSFETENFAPRSERQVAKVPHIAPPSTGSFLPVVEAPPTPVDEIADFGLTGAPSAPGGEISETHGLTENPPPPSLDPETPVTYVDELPYVLSKVMPAYPEIAKQAMVGGRVLVLVLVGRDGRVREARVDEHQHSPLLDGAALDAARQWIFSPATVNAHPVAVWTAVPFRFVLSEGSVR